MVSRFGLKSVQLVAKLAKKTGFTSDSANRKGSYVERELFIEKRLTYLPRVFGYALCSLTRIRETHQLTNSVES